MKNSEKIAAELLEALGDDAKATLVALDDTAQCRVELPVGDGGGVTIIPKHRFTMSDVSYLEHLGLVRYARESFRPLGSSLRLVELTGLGTAAVQAMRD